MEAQDTLKPLTELVSNFDFKKFSKEEFEIINLISKLSFDGVKIKHVYANINPKKINSRILIIKGPILKIFPYIRTLLTACDSVKENPTFCEVLGFFTKSSKLDNAKFGLVTLNYELNILNFRSLRSFKRKSFSEIIFETFKGISFLHSKGFFYGYLKPGHIQMTINHRPKIELHFFIKKIDKFNFQEYLNELEVLKRYSYNYLAPEVIFAFKNRGYSFNAIDPTSIDYFAAGCISFKLLGYNLNPLILNCSSFCDTGLAINQNKESPYNLIKDLSQRESIIKIIKDFESNIRTKKINDPQITKLLELSTKVYISKRSVNKFLFETENKYSIIQIENATSFTDFTEIVFRFYTIISIIRSIQFTRESIRKNVKCEIGNSSQEELCAKKTGFETDKLLSPALNPSNTLSEQEIKKSRDLSSPSLDLYSLTIDSVFVYNFTYDNYDILLKALLKLEAMQKNLALAFDRAYTSFYSTECSNSNIKLVDGLMIFLHNSVSYLSGNKAGVIILSQELKNDELLTKDQFLYFFKQIKNLSEIHQNFIVFSLIKMKIERDWHNFFNLTFFSRLLFYKLKDVTILMKEFSSILKKRFIIESLQKFNPSGMNIRLILNQLLENIYLTRLMTSRSGMSTYNNFIFIDCEISDFYNQIETLQHRTIFYIILLHELAHLLRRINCTTFQQARNTLILTSMEEDSKQAIEDDFKTEREWEGAKGKAGFMFEKMIFREIITAICIEAADYFVYCNENITLEEFSRVFQNIQKTGTNHIWVQRDGNHVGDLPIRCSFGISKYR